jgi:L-fucose dehydrogenase
MDLGLQNKAVIVTGGHSGIGEAIARELLAEGAFPILVGRKGERGKIVEAELRAENANFLSVEADLSEPTQCQSAVLQAIEKYGKISGLVNNAGFNDGIGLENGSPESFLQSLRNNIYHYYSMAHYCLPYLKKEKDSSIINIASKTAITGQGGTSAYVASKAGQLGLTREWAVELLPFQIRVNAIVPAEVMTPLYASWLGSFENPEEKLAQITKRIPLGKRMTTPEEIASTALFLLSNKAQHITGQYLFVDGGYTHLDRAIT